MPRQAVRQLSKIAFQSVAGALVPASSAGIGTARNSDRRPPGSMTMSVIPETVIGGLPPVTRRSVPNGTRGSGLVRYQK